MEPHTAWRRAGAGWVVFGLAMLVWEIAARLAASLDFPALSSILLAFWKVLLSRRVIMGHILPGILCSNGID